MKSVEIVLKREGESMGKRGEIEVRNLIGVHCMHVWKYYNEILLYN
jgi:hypothetical protein